MFAECRSGSSEKVLAPNTEITIDLPQNSTKSIDLTGKLKTLTTGTPDRATVKFALET